jgi:hypothetical protein
MKGGFRIPLLLLLATNDKWRQIYSAALLIYWKPYATTCAEHMAVPQYLTVHYLSRAVAILWSVKKFLSFTFSHMLYIVYFSILLQRKENMSLPDFDPFGRFEPP